MIKSTFNSNKKTGSTSSIRRRVYRVERLVDSIVSVDKILSHPGRMDKDDQICVVIAKSDFSITDQILCPQQGSFSHVYFRKGLKDRASPLLSSMGSPNRNGIISNRLCSLLIVYDGLSHFFSLSRIKCGGFTISGCEINAHVVGG